MRGDGLEILSAGPYADNAPAHEASHRRGRLDLRKTAPGQGSFPHEQCHPGFVEERTKERVRSSMSFLGKRELLVQLAPAMAVFGSGSGRPFWTSSLRPLAANGSTRSACCSARPCWPSVQRRWTGCCPAASASRVE